MIIYLHGFRSGPESWKARSLRARMAAHGLADAFWCEQLPVSARDAVALADEAEALEAVAEAMARLAVRNLDGYLTTGELVTPVLPPRR